MTGYERYAIYVAPPPGQFADFAAAWLGWDPAAGETRTHPHIPDLPRPVAELTAAPRRYGFHGTVKPPFRLAEGATIGALHDEMTALAAALPPVALPGLALRRLGGFLALTPDGDSPELAALATEVVTALDGFRAPPGGAEIARRQAAGLSPRQQALLARWGYPYVMEEFRFHLTLTGALPDPEAAAVEAALAPILALILPRPYVIDSLCLFGEAEDGHFHNLHSYTLSG